jgi:hypothetical protein
MKANNQYLQPAGSIVPITIITAKITLVSSSNEEIIQDILSKHRLYTNLKAHIDYHVWSYSVSLNYNNRKS